MMAQSDHYELAFFEQNGFERRICTSCGSGFWTLDPQRDGCGDPPCQEYTFIGDPITKDAYELGPMRDRFLSYLEASSHTKVRPQPVVARWREDIFLNIASISNYQPHVTSGISPPPANPLAVSQPCIRLDDVDSVGRSGRHLTMFEMMAHHCFNYPDGHPFLRKDTAGNPEDYYFKERTVELCQGFLDTLNIPEESITYKENPWAGGGNAGPAFEVLTHGLEVATLVFMQWEQDPAGDINVKGDTYKEMDLTIVDTGYGLERFVWASQGTPTIYESVFPETISLLVEELDNDPRKDPKTSKILAEHAKLSSILDVDTGAKLNNLRKQVPDRLAERGIDTTPSQLAERLAPLEAAYAIADHSRCLTFMLGDGIVPSNVRDGYLARLLIRKSLRLMDEAGIDIDLYDVVETHLEALRDDYPHLWSARDQAADMLELETQRFQETLTRGRRLVERELEEDTQSLNLDRLIDLYDSHGMPPEIVQNIAHDQGTTLEIPDDFYARVSERHDHEEIEEDTHRPDPPDLPDTERMYYEDATTKDFTATALWSGSGPDHDDLLGVVLDRTHFYPEGGGQPPDQGFLFVREQALPVEDVQTWGNLVVHYIDSEEEVKNGERVRGQLDWGRRQALTKNHTATHLIGGAVRSVLGNHAWQTGAQKGTTRSRLDVTHYKRIDEEELREIETLANLMVLEGRTVEKTWLDRVDAEQKYGFRLYQGGIPDSDEIRIVRIPEYDVQACGGTHVANTGELGLVKLFRSERIQDGVERVEFAAGLAALRQIQSREDLLQEAAGVFEVPLKDLPRTARRFFDEWKEYRKEAQSLREELARQKLASFSDEAEEIDGVSLVSLRLDLELDDLVSAAGEWTGKPGRVAVLGGVKDGSPGLVVAVSDEVEGVDAREVVNEGGQVLGGGGGGSPLLARAGGPNADQIDEAIEAASDRVRKALGP